MLQAGFYFYGPGGFFFMLEVKLRNSTSIKLMNYCIDKYVQVILCLFAYSDVLHAWGHTPSPPPFLEGSVLLIFLVFCFVFFFVCFVLFLFLFLFFACFCFCPVSCVPNCITTQYDGQI